VAKVEVVGNAVRLLVHFENANLTLDVLNAMYTACFMIETA
jgi:hypothetical protein